MKNSNICPKCQKSDIARIEGSVGAHGAGNNIFTGMTAFSAVKVMRFVCLSCGFSEEWIDSEKDIEKIRKAYK